MLREMSLSIGAPGTKRETGHLPRVHGLDGIARPIRSNDEPEADVDDVDEPDRGIKVQPVAVRELPPVRALGRLERRRAFHSEYKLNREISIVFLQ